MVVCLCLCESTYYVYILYAVGVLELLHILWLEYLRVFFRAQLVCIIVIIVIVGGAVLSP
jgi:hypothetical protein